MGGRAAIEGRHPDVVRPAFFAGILAAGGLVLAQSVAELAARPLEPQWLMLVALTMVSGWATLRLRAVPASFSISDTFTIAAALLFGPAAATVTVAVDALVMSSRLSGRPAPLRVLFNATGPPLAMWIAAQMFFQTAGVGPLAHRPGTIRELVGPLAVFALLYFVLNTGFVASAVALERGVSVATTWRRHFVPLWLTYFGGASLAGVLVLMAVARLIDLSALMMVLPLVVVLHLAYRAALDRASERVDHLTKIGSYATALRSTADGVLITDSEQRITLMNAAGERLTGWAEHEAHGRPLDEVFRTVEPASGGSRPVLNASEGTLRECRLVDRTGGERPIEEMHASIRNEDGDTSGSIITFRDISQRLAIDAQRNALLQREQHARLAADGASRMKDEFLTTLSHELRTPATSILGWVRLLRTGRIEPAAREHALDALERSARAQAALIEDLLDVSSIVIGALHFDPRTTRLPEVLEAAVAAVSPPAAAKGVALEVTVADTLPPLVADPGRLRQVFWNLLSNAVKFTDRGGSVHARLTCTADHVEFEVRDSGRGIDPEWLPFIFDRFRQGDSSTTRSHGGLGLGLTLVRHIVEHHGGTVMAMSEGVGHGAQFSVRLPVMRTPADSGPS